MILLTHEQNPMSKNKLCYNQPPDTIFGQNEFSYACVLQTNIYNCVHKVYLIKNK